MRPDSAFPGILKVVLAAFLLACRTPTGATAADAGATAEFIEGECAIDAGGGGASADASSSDAGAVEFLKHIGCTADFKALASAPLDSTLPGARSVKVVLDQADGDALYFQNSVLYQIHYAFASTHLSGNGLPIVSALADFNSVEYYRPDRRFMLGAVTFYDEPKVWALEVAPYDTASAAMITKLHKAVQSAAFFGPGLSFHPTSDSVKTTAAKLSGIPVITTDQLYASIDYQPLTVATAYGRLVFAKAAELESTFLSYQDIVVLDQAPNDISVVQGIITQEFQTPLSHLNVLSRNRHAPNMGLRNALSNEKLLALEGKLVKLDVGLLQWNIREATAEEARAYLDAHMPTPMTLPAMNLDVRGLVDIEDVAPDPPAGGSLREAIKTAVLAFGGKAAHYSVLAQLDDVPVRKAFAIPVYYYWKFMTDNGFFDRVDALMADTQFTTDPAVRSAKLQQMRDDMKKAPLDPDLEAALKAKLAADYPGLAMRFRTSTNSEDLDGFPCAGCYESHTGDPADWEDVRGAIRESFASTWLFRTFEERTYYGIDHKSVGMALLVHHNFPNEDANGVAVTCNPFDVSGLDPAFYVNVQYRGDVEVVHPAFGTSSDQFLLYFDQPNQPTSYLAHSNLIPAGTTVLSARQIHQLGLALNAIHERFSAAYGPAAGNLGWYAMDVEFKFDHEAAPSEAPALYIKQARSYPQAGMASE
jgi:hypothetical protein